MRKTRNITEQDILGDDTATAEIDKDISTDKKAVNPYRHKISFAKYDGDASKLQAQKFNNKGQPLPETKDDIINRSMFFSNFVNERYKIIMIYKGRGDVLRRRLFDIFKKKNKTKYNFFKEKGIIF